MKNNLLIIGLLALLSVSCNKSKDYDAFVAGMYTSLIATSSIIFEEPELVNSSESITRPPLAWKLLFRANIKDERGSVGACMFYKTPHRDQLGSLVFIPIKRISDCKLIIDPSVELALAKLDSVSNLKMKKGSDGFSDYEFAFEFTFDNEKKIISIPLYNLEKKVEFKRFSSPVMESHVTGVKIKTKLPVPDILITRGQELIPVSDDPVLCHDIGNNCIENSPNRCDQCRYGWFPSASGISCKNGGVKYCRPNNCGAKGMPACPRGLTHRTYVIEDFCVADSPIAFCEKGLRVICSDKKQLICL